MKKKMQVLIVDDDRVTQQIIGAYCIKKQLKVHYADSGVEALNIIYSENIDMVITDIRMPELDGKALLQHIKAFSMKLPVLLMTAHSSIDEAVLLLKSGAEDYIPKPISPDVLMHRLNLVLERLTLTTELETLRSQKGNPSILDQIIGNAPVFRALMGRLPLIAQTDAATMITGESGTGKEMVASAIHQLSKRKTEPFVTVNCGALPDNLLESELFGYKKGAFTDAYQDTPGLVEEAAGGTLFLDEIGEISSVVQVKLLRFLQNKEYKQLGSPKSHKANVRIICATNRNLDQMVKDKTFREDLYYRLNIIPIIVPALRERKADIPLLANYFLAHFAKEYEKEVDNIANNIIKSFMDYHWPGNVRELENKIQQMVVLSETKEIQFSKPIIPKKNRSKVTDELLSNFKTEKKRVVDSFERSYIQRMLEQTKGNLSEAAKLAGMDRKNFWEKARRHNVRQSTSPNIYSG